MGYQGNLTFWIERHCVTSAMRWIAIEWPRAWRWSARYNHAGRWLRVVVQNFNSETIGSSKKIKFLLEMKVSSMCKTYCTNVLQGFGRLDCPSGSRYRVAGLSISFAAIITWRNRPLPWNCTNIKRLRVNILVCVIPVETEKLRASPKIDCRHQSCVENHPCSLGNSQNLSIPWSSRCIIRRRSGEIGIPAISSVASAQSLGAVACSFWSRASNEAVWSCWINLDLARSRLPNGRTAPLALRPWHSFPRRSIQVWPQVVVFGRYFSFYVPLFLVLQSDRPRVFMYRPEVI